MIRKRATHNDPNSSAIFAGLAPLPGSITGRTPLLRLRTSSYSSRNDGCLFISVRMVAVAPERFRTYGRGRGG